VSRARLTLVVAAIAGLALALAPAAGAKTKTTTFSSGPLGTPIGDNAAAASRVALPKGKVKDVNVLVRLTHGVAQDVDLSLLPPQGPPLVLSTDNGATGNSYGAGPNDCTGSFTVFDDSSPIAIQAAEAPFVGFFRPEHPLATLNGIQMKGPWWFLFADDAGGNSGILGCWQLQVTYQAKKK
jgi:subtilisin-like proprotein convertase family protein